MYNAEQLWTEFFTPISFPKFLKKNYMYNQIFDYQHIIKKKIVRISEVTFNGNYGEYNNGD